MNEIVREWLDKSQMDFETAEREFAVESRTNYDAVCFHFQQAIEKLMKSLIIELGDIPPKTHNLEVLSKLISTSNNDWNVSSSDLRLLTHAASDFRYPGETASRLVAERTRQIAVQLRNRLLAEFQ